MEDVGYISQEFEGTLHHTMSISMPLAIRQSSSVHIKKGHTALYRHCVMAPATLYA